MIHHTLFYFGAEAERSYCFWQFEPEMFLLCTFEGRLCLFSFQVFSFPKFVILTIFASVCFHVARKILVIFATLTCSADFSRAFFAFLPFKSFLLLNLLFLLFLRYWLAFIFTLQVKFLLLLLFLRHLHVVRTSQGPSLPFYLSSVFFL